MASQGMAAYRHEAFLYGDTDAFVDGAVRFLREGLASGEAALVVVGAPKIAALRDALGRDGDRVRFADMAEVGRNPARIIPAWREFVDAGGGRGIGEPIYPERSADELVECQHHESLLNLAFAGTSGFHLLCPYDTTALPADVIDVAHHTHPLVNAAGSDGYTGDDAPGAPFTGPLRSAPAGAARLVFGVGDLPEVRAVARGITREGGLDRRQADDLLLGVNEIAINSLTHGGGHGVLRAWVDTASVICEISGGGRITDPLVGRVAPSPDGDRGRGVWVANQVCDLVQIRSGPDGTTVRLHVAR